MAYTRIKQERNDSELERARAKLNTALQNVLEKTNESPSSSDEDLNKETIVDISCVKKEQLPVSPKKPAIRVQRKRRRKDDVTIRASNTCVMKLFDRQVDLSPFNEETPLYPICRSWINNQPHQLPTTVKEEAQDPSKFPTNPDGEMPEDQGMKEVYQLPLPNSRELSGISRIPSPIPQPQEEFLISSDEHAPTKETLMAKHMERWRAVRQKWKQAAQANEFRYKESGTMLKAMFEKSQCRDDIPKSTDPWEAVPTFT